MKALFTYNYGSQEMAAIRQLGYDVLIVEENKIEYTPEMAEAEVLVCYNPFKALDISRLKALKWIQLSSIGIDQVPMDVLKKNNILLTNNRGGYSIPMGEWVVMKLLEIYKKSRILYQQQDKKRWKMNKDVLELYGKTVAFIGTGSIGQESAKRLQGFGVNIVGVNTKGTDVEYFHSCYPISRLEEVLGKSDAVVLTIPYTEVTHHLINKQQLEAMKPEAVLINVSRGSIINEAALIKHLQEGKLMGVALDVFEEEPLPSEHPLWDFDRVIITPHNSWISELRNDRKYEMIYDNLKAYIQGRPLTNVINLNRGY